MGMTVQIIKDEAKMAKYGKNYLCFWAILAILWALEYTILYFFCGMNFYRVLRLALVIWLQVDYCGNAATLFLLVKPLISKEHEERLQAVLENVTSEIDKHGGKIKEKASDQFWSIIQQNYELIKEGVFTAMTTVSKKAGDMASPKAQNAESESAPDVSEKPADQKKES